MIYANRTLNKDLHNLRKFNVSRHSHFESCEYYNFVEFQINPASWQFLAVHIDLRFFRVNVWLVL